MNTEIFKRAATKHKGTIAGGFGGAGIVTLLLVIVPFFQEKSDSDARQWQKLSVLEQRIVVLETRLDLYKEQLQMEKK